VFDAVFEVSPAGICGMNTLASFLNTMKSNRDIMDWSPRRAITESKGGRYVVEFPSQADAARAHAAWAKKETSRSR
jgi:hypothetical protein